MTLRQFHIIAGRTRYELRPTLQAAVALHAKRDMRIVLRDIAEARIGTLRAILDATMVDQSEDAVSAVRARVFRPFVSDAHLRLFTDIGWTLIGVEDSEAFAQRAEGSTKESTDLNNYYRSLFKIGTGNLGWTPEATWNATPVEILVANEGRNDLLKAIFGSNDDKATKAPEAQTTEKAEANALSWFRRQKLKIVGRTNA